MAPDLRTALEILRLYGPLLQQLARSALASAVQALKAFSFTEAHGENT